MKLGGRWQHIKVIHPLSLTTHPPSHPSEQSFKTETKKKPINLLLPWGLRLFSLTVVECVKPDIKERGLGSIFMG